ncbi:hypothetical protein ACFSL6_25010 [Paenibacillus thailandensis]|uniref:XkdX family protein n=1 Tax=Paenibacillus thailandensis TaxID=393250 RepID=A0ABW5R3H3_9BACL
MSALLDFWVKYVQIKVSGGYDSGQILEQIETKYGAEFRQQVEDELNDVII